VLPSDQHCSLEQYDQRTGQGQHRDGVIAWGGDGGQHEQSEQDTALPAFQLCIRQHSDPVEHYH
jgi:hypothetical protein